jgi:transposase-like protein
MKQLTKAPVLRTRKAELADPPGCEKHAQGEKPRTKGRNRKSTKALKSGCGPMAVEAPRDREGTFEPQTAPKHQRGFRGFDDKILSMYAPGLTARRIQEHFKDRYAVKVSLELTSRAAGGVKEPAAERRDEPLNSFIR